MIQDIAPSTLDNRFCPEAMPAMDDAVFVVDKQAVACRCDGEAGTHGASFVLPRVSDISCCRQDKVRSLTYLFELDGRAFWYLDAREADDLPNFSLVPNARLRREGRGPKSLMFALYTAVHLGGWYRSNRFCGACGHAMTHDGTLRALRCPACGNLVFPRLNPAVIVAVCDPAAQRIVLTRYAAGRYHNIDALVAGFVEIGETLEQCVEREVYEELGLRVRNIRYYKSQPWGIAGDILSGFWVDVDGDTTIRMDASELGRAFWAAPEEVTGQPDDLSLTNEMMCAWRDAHLCASDAE